MFQPKLHLEPDAGSHRVGPCVVDQLQIIGNRIDAAERARADAEIEAAIAAAFDFAERSKFPGSEDLFTYVFAD